MNAQPSKAPSPFSARTAEEWAGLRVRVMAEFAGEEFKRRRDPFWRRVLHARIGEVLWWVRRVPQLRPDALAAFRYGKGRHAS